MPKPVTKKKFRVGVAARTVDGREIKREYIERAAALYDPNVYGARINLEHFRSVLADSPFKALGDVTAVEFKEETIGGEKRGVIYAELEPSAELIAMNKAGQKVYTSMELQPNFPNEGDFYLTGLAVTDSPASMGTQRLSFSAAEQGENLIGEYTDTEFLFSDDSEDDSNAPTIGERIKEIFSRFKKTTDGKNGELEQALELVAVEVANFASKIPADQSEAVSQLESKLADLEEKFSTLESEYQEMATAMEGSEQFSRRPPATGGNTNTMTDC